MNVNMRQIGWQHQQIWAALTAYPYYYYHFPIRTTALAKQSSGIKAIGLQEILGGSLELSEQNCALDTKWRQSVRLDDHNRNRNRDLDVELRGKLLRFAL